MREWGRIALKSIISILMVLWQVNLFAQDEEFKPSGKLNAQVFADYYYVASADTAVSSKTAPLKNTVLKKEKDYNAFMIRRMYLGYEYKFSPKISTMIRLEADEGSLTSSGKTDVFLKDASLKWAICEGQNMENFAAHIFRVNFQFRHLE